MSRRALAALALVAGLALAAGCAQQGSMVGPGQPDAILEFTLRLAGPVNDACYYFLALDTDNDNGATFPVPVAAGPFWGNGWGTGSITYFLEYHLGQYNLFQTQLSTVLGQHTGGLVNLTGTAAGTAAGKYQVTVQSLTRGAATVSGAGMIQAAANTGDQNAGVLTLATDASGNVVAGSVGFTPAADGGRALTSAEQSALAALNAGGVPLLSNSLAFLGLSLTLGPAAAGTQSLTVAPTVASVDVVFTSASTGQTSTSSGTLTSNSLTSTTTPPIPGVTFLTADLGVGDSATVSVELSPNAVLVQPSWFQYTLPSGGNTLSASLDLAALGTNLTNISFNFITTTELIFDPTLTDPRQHVYDGLGPLGNDAVRRFDPRQFLSLSNSDSLIPEGPGDSTLQGPATPDQRSAVDIVDWSLAVRRLQ